VLGHGGQPLEEYLLPDHDTVDDQPAFEIRSPDVAPLRIERTSREMELEHRSLRVKLDFVPKPSTSPLPSEAMSDVQDAAFAVIRMSVEEIDTSRTSIAFVVAPAPSLRGQIPKFAPAGSRAAQKNVEVGGIHNQAEVVGLAERLAQRLRT
jgi:hypothetical protein